MGISALMVTLALAIGIGYAINSTQNFAWSRSGIMSI